MEYVVAVNEHDKVIGKVRRKEAHEKGIWHRGSLSIVLNGKKILCQKRSKKKDLFPSYWTIFFGGHSEPGESYLKTVKREIKEELGIVPKNLKKLIKIGKIQSWHTLINKEFVTVYLWKTKRRNFKFNKDEISKIEFLTFEELEKALKKRKFVPLVKELYALIKRRIK